MRNKMDAGVLWDRRIPLMRKHITEPVEMVVSHLGEVNLLLFFFNTYPQILAAVAAFVIILS